MTPGLSKSACRLNYWFYQPKFPSPVLVSSQIFGPCPPVFPRALARSHGWDAWLPWQELPSADSQTMAPPGAATVSEPTSSLKLSALHGYSPSMLTWQAGAPGPFPGCPCPMAPGAPHHAGPGRHWPRGQCIGHGHPGKGPVAPACRVSIEGE